MAKTRVLIAESSDIVLLGLLAILNSSRSIDVVDTASDLSEGIKLYAKHAPDLCLISDSFKDLNIHEFMQNLYKHDDKAKVVLLTDSLDINYLNQALKAGITGCLLKSIDKKKLKQSLISVAEGEKVFSDAISNLMTDRYADLAQNKTGQSSFDKITKREREILQMIVDGYTSQEIAKQLYISPRTVETHRSNLLQKLQMKNTAALVRYALEKGPFSKT